MKKYIEHLTFALLAMLSFTACTEEEGTEPGNDSQPSIIIYQYDASLPYNVDNDVVLRFATNNKTSEAYYLIESEDDYNSHISSMSEEDYKDYVVSNGTKIEGVSGEANVDVTVTDLYGTYVITAVAVSGNTKVSYSTTFTGLEWEDVTTGTYYFNAVSSLGLSPTEVVLQVCTTDDTMYRLKDLYGEGYSLKLNLIDYQGSDADGTYQYFRIPETTTSYTYGSYGTVSVRDIGYWQDDSSYVTAGGYESGMYSDYSCFLCIQYYVSAGSLGYGYDYFIPNN